MDWNASVNGYYSCNKHKHKHKHKRLRHLANPKSKQYLTFIYIGLCTCVQFLSLYIYNLPFWLTDCMHIQTGEEKNWVGNPQAFGIFLLIYESLQLERMCGKEIHTIFLFGFFSENWTFLLRLLKQEKMLPNHRFSVLYVRFTTCIHKSRKDFHLSSTKNEKTETYTFHSNIANSKKCKPNVVRGTNHKSYVGGRRCLISKNHIHLCKC